MADLHLVQRPISALPILAKIPIPGSPDWVGIGNGAVWISNIDKNNISRIDPTKNKVVAEYHRREGAVFRIGHRLREYLGPLLR